MHQQLTAASLSPSRQLQSSTRIPLVPSPVVTTLFMPSGLLLFCSLFISANEVNLHRKLSNVMRNICPLLRSCLHWSAELADRRCAAAETLNVPPRPSEIISCLEKSLGLKHLLFVSQSCTTCTETVGVSEWAYGCACVHIMWEAGKFGSLLLIMI